MRGKNPKALRQSKPWPIDVRQLVRWGRMYPQIGASLVLAGLMSAMAVNACDATPVQKNVPAPRAHPAKRIILPPVPLAKPSLKQAEPEGASVKDEGETAQTPCETTLATIVDLPPVVGDNGCGFTQAVELTEVSGKPAVGFAPNPVISCRFANDLAAWIGEDVARLALDIKGEELKRVHTGPGYQCRRRNNLPDGKLSEHALGHALDISSFELASGEIVSIKDNWDAEASGDPKSAAFLQAVRKSACARFTTVLSPDGDVYHQSHLHVDIGCHGKTCTYRICQ